MEKIFSPEKVAHTQKERTLSDAELLKGGAEYKLDEKGENIMLEATEEQKDKAKEEMESDKVLSFCVSEICLALD